MALTAKDLIKNNSLTNIAVTGQKVVFKEIALTAVNMAALEMKEKAIEAFRQFIEEYCSESGRTDISKDSGHYLKVFEKLMR